jgi:hAT family C-terminal dimerisation region
LLLSTWFLCTLLQKPSIANISIAITAHWIDSDFIMHEELLDFTEIPGSHKGIRLADHVYKVLKAFDIQHKLFCITTDNAENNRMMSKCLSTLLHNNDGIIWDPIQNHIDCLAHVLNLAVQSFIANLKVLPLTDEEKFDLEIPESDGDDLEDLNPLRRTGALLPPINSSQPTTFKDTMEKLRSLSKAINFPPTRLQAFWLHCDMFELPHIKAVTDSQIRWSAQYDMIKRAIFLKPAFDNFARYRPELQKYVLTNREWELAEFLLRFLAPFKAAIDRLQGTAKPTLQKTFQIYEELFNGLENIKAVFQEMKPVPHWISDVRSGIEAMWTKLSKYYNRTAQPFAYYDATILHPGKKLSLFKRSSWQGETPEQCKEACRLRYNTKYTTIDVQWERTVQNKKRKHIDLDSDNSSSSDEQEHVFDEFDHYLESRRDKTVDDPLVWWRKSGSMFPRLSKMTRDVLAVPATGAGVEREFSISGRVVSKLRGRLSAETISDIMFYKRWVARHGRYMLDENIEDERDDEQEEEGSSVGQGQEESDVKDTILTWLEKWQRENTLRVTAERIGRVVA